MRLQSFPRTLDLNCAGMQKCAGARKTVIDFLVVFLPPNCVSELRSSFSLVLGIWYGGFIPGVNDRPAAIPERAQSLRRVQSKLPARSHRHHVLPWRGRMPLQHWIIASQ